jgi:type VI secretion system secreted protein VgrG
MFAAVELLHEVEDQALFRATVVPRLWQLTRTLHSRIFTDQSIPEILRDVLERGGLSTDDFTLQLAQDYPPHEHVCQYRESDFDFISRWMEREGMYYYFEHEGAGERLVISDNKSFQHELDDRPVRFFALAGGDVTAQEALHTLTCKHHALPSEVRLRDYNDTKPMLDVSGSATVTRSGAGEINVYGARFFSPEEGRRLAALRAEELLSREVVFHGSGTARYLRAGYVFHLKDHPRAPFNAAHLVVAATHHGNQAIGTPELRALTGLSRPDVYWVEVQTIPAGVQFRAESATRWPRVDGSENGTVCGPAESEYAQIDDAGRYKVSFKFDESGLAGGKASTWVRMLQPHGGNIEGWHFPLRKGTEVLFTFLGGDPDRPVIAGVVPNALTPSPVTRANHTTNIIRTGGRNELELEDEDGHERITLKTPYCDTMLRMGAPNDNHNMILTTKGNTLIKSGVNTDVTIGGLTTQVFVGGKVALTIAGTTETFIGAKASTFISAETSVFLGVKTAVNIGAQLNFNTVSINYSAVGLSQAKVDLKERGLKVQNNGMTLQNNGLTVIQ